MQGKAFESWEKQAKEEQMGYAEVNSTLRHTKRYAFRIESIFPEWLFVLACGFPSNDH